MKIYADQIKRYNCEELTCNYLSAYREDTYIGTKIKNHNKELGITKKLDNSVPQRIK